ncbi:Polyol:NADP oxidoreductase [Jannaschia seosinensis]|uniref:Polyol:NADP oxidoreductase n=1 Tax=Jannaschia seosinensis TaxID=313367 RepID=A0A0M7BAY8_9RHOB|nr:mannitol dehydrogenase family protein [Jannaschia seosinensis]CUH39900.1 Polyol:NADP oxidoreductase [Jannaschia seosinensis]
MTRLTAKLLPQLPEGVRPAYDPAAQAAGILHLGLGAFHRAHQAFYTDAALARDGGDWRILAVSLRSTETVDALRAQDGLFTLVERGPHGDRAQVIGAVADALAAARDSQEVLAVFERPEIRIVTLTVTEKAYGFDRASMDIEPGHEAIAADLAAPQQPRGVIGLLVEGLRRRRAADLRPPAILCCDNLPENGPLLRAGVLGFARRVDVDLAEWIAQEVAFPASMVDRITPATTDETAKRAQALIGADDAAAVETEPFTQWVIEENFPQGRPSWEAGGAVFVADVAPFERMKLRMLNGAHSLIAYAGFLAGHAYVRDAMSDASLAVLVDRHIRAAAGTVGRLEGIDLDAYRADLLARFANPAIAHQTYQIAMDGTEKLPQRIFAPATDALTSGADLAPYAFAVAAWMCYATGRDAKGKNYDLRDPREDELRRAVLHAGNDASALVAALTALPSFFPVSLRDSPAFRHALETRLAVMLDRGMPEAIRREAA